MTTERDLKDITSDSLQSEILAGLHLSTQRARILPYLEELVRRASEATVIIEQTYTSFVSWYEIARRNPQEDCYCGRVAVVGFLRDELDINVWDLNPSERWRAEHVNCCDCDWSPDVPSLQELIEEWGPFSKETPVI